MSERPTLWVRTGPPPRRPLAKARPLPEGRSCHRCGYGPLRARRKKCPACFTPVEAP